MLTYLVAIFVATLFVFVSEQFNFNRYAKTVTYWLAFIPLIIITAFKYRKVGTDTGTYIFYFEKLTTFESVIDMHTLHGEGAFWFLNFLGHTFTDNYFIIFLFSSLIVSTCYLIVVKHFKLGTLSFLTLLLIGPYFFQLNGNRQAITIALFAVAVIFILEKKPWHYLLVIFVGFFFHKSMIICLPIYYIFRNEIKPGKLVFIIVSFLVLLVFFDSFVNAASGVDSRYSTYAERQNNYGGAIVSLFNLALFGWFLLVRHANPKALPLRTFDTMLAIYFLGILICLLSLILKINPSGFLRMSIYFIQMNMFLLPMTIYSFRIISTRTILIISMVPLMLLYFYMTTSAFSNLVPYRFNPVLG